jgi:hypothetical protein
MFSRRRQRLADYEAKVVKFYGDTVEMKKKTLVAARVIVSACSAFLFFVQRLETHRPLYMALNWVFAAKG